MSDVVVMTMPVTFARPTFCPYCNSDTIELYDERGRGLKYQLMIGMNDFKSLDAVKHIEHFKCMRCHKTFNIDWIENIPYPRLSSYIHDVFMDNYINS